MLKGYLLNPAAVTGLTDEYELFAITRDPLIWDELFESMRALQATWFAGDLPRPHREGRALLLPRDDRHSMTVASVLRQAGVPDLGSYLQRQANPAPWATAPPTGDKPLLDGLRYGSCPPRQAPLYQN